MSLQRLLSSMMGKEIRISPYGGKGFEINAEKPAYQPIVCKITEAASDYIALSNGAIIPIRAIVFINRPKEM